MKLTPTLLVIIFLFILQPFAAQAQKEAEEININIGAGYSPGFNNGSVEFYSARVINPLFIQSEGEFACSATPNFNVTADYKVGLFSAGIATSYQSEVVNWEDEYRNGPPYWTDKVSRINLALRFLFHLKTKSPNFDFYAGFRPGACYWSDKAQNTLIISGSDTLQRQTNFLSLPSHFVFCIQSLLGLHVFLSDVVGFHIELGIGEPYMLEGGLTFRFATRKKPENTGPESLPGHTHQ